MMSALDDPPPVAAVQDDDDRSPLILYATETGTAHDAANTIARQCRRIHLRARVHSVDDYPLEDLITEPTLIFVLSTTGLGSPPRALLPLWRTLLRADLPPDLFDASDYAVFGLGDSSYEKFCWPAKVVGRRMGKLGGREVVGRGEGDEMHRMGIDGALDPWIESLLDALLEIYPLPPGKSVLPADTLFKPTIRLVPATNLPATNIPILDADTSGPSSAASSPPSTPRSAFSERQLDTDTGTLDADTIADSSRAPPADPSLAPQAIDPSFTPQAIDPAPDASYHTATVLTNRRLTAPTWWQDVRHIEFKVGEDVRYAPGDIALIHPHAPAAAVDAFLDAVGWTEGADDPIYVIGDDADDNNNNNDSSNKTTPPPTPTTLRALLTHRLNISAVPRRSFFQLLVHFLADEREREKVQEWVGGGEEGADDLYTYATRPRRTILEVLAEFRSARGRIPRGYVFELVPGLRARAFSIAGAVSRHPGEVHLCVAIVQYKTRLKAPRRGVCTSYLADLKPGDTLTLGIQSGLIRLPSASTQAPVICVGPGTGIAPMRAIVEDRLDSGGETLLYAGHRSASADALYTTEFSAYAAASDGRLRYRVAFSRDGAPGEGKRYVQDLIREDALGIREDIREDVPGVTREDALDVREDARGALREDAPGVWALLERGAVVVISGSAGKMPEGVKAALREVVRLGLGLGDNGGGEKGDGDGDGEEREREARAKAYVERMEKEGRLLEECWS
ncbi:hypothetical protein PLICRDRAFT_583078 [Plicaturopsis crispa FD-325 SS-3]|nr:hypothetical protein PLICRDRAFT_583078 [Plicaturopsis crispa FD-325 SS-3]